MSRQDVKPYNVEQIYDDSVWMTPALLALLGATGFETTVKPTSSGSPTGKCPG
jgi:hypothetical protein